MAAGTQYNAFLNSDKNFVKTPTIYDSNLDEWLMLAGNYVKTAGGLWVPQKGSDNGEALVQLTGRNIEVVKFFDALAIADTKHHPSPIISLAKYKKVAFITYSTLDQPVKLFPQFDYNYNAFCWDGTAWQTYHNLGRYAEIPSDTLERYLLNTFFTEFADMPIEKMCWVAKCDTAPTTGSITLLAWGVPN